MIKTLRALWTIFGIILIIGLVMISTVIIKPLILVDVWNLDKEFTSYYGSYVIGITSVIFSFISIFIIINNLYKQNIELKKSQVEVHFFKMLDYHNEIVRNVYVENPTDNKIYEGRKAFVLFKKQLTQILALVNKISVDIEEYNFSKKEIIDIAFLIFNYGKDNPENKFLRSKINQVYAKKFITLLNGMNNEISDIEGVNTILSVYFRNMYNAIKFVTDCNLLNFKEKKKLIKIYRAQLSNPELYVIFLYLVSRFGKKWFTETDNFVCKYEFIKNLPLDYCGEYSPKEFFKGIVWEEEELGN